MEMETWGSPSPPGPARGADSNVALASGNYGSAGVLVWRVPSLKFPGQAQERSLFSPQPCVFGGGYGAGQGYKQPLLPVIRDVTSTLGSD